MSDNIITKHASIHDIFDSDSTSYRNTHVFEVRYEPDSEGFYEPMSDIRHLEITLKCPEDINVLDNIMKPGVIWCVPHIMIFKDGSSVYTVDYTGYSTSNTEELVNSFINQGCSILKSFEIALKIYEL